MNKYIAGDLVESAKRLKAGQSRKPLRSFNELCEEFGVAAGTLSNHLKKEGAPEAKFMHCGGKKYYDPDEMRKWWAGLKK